MFMCTMYSILMSTHFGFVSILVCALSFHSMQSSESYSASNITEVYLNITEMEFFVPVSTVPTPPDQHLNITMESITEPVTDPATIPWFLLSLFYQLDPNKSERFLVIDVTEYICSSTKLCYTNLTKHPLCTYECTECLCDEMCHYYGDCCPDLLFGDSPHTPPAPNVYLDCEGASWTTWANHSNIFMVSRCPEKRLYSDKDVVKKCASPDIHYRDQATPVSTIDSQITYRNIYCAMCHGVTNLEPWVHQVKCISSVNLNKATTRDELWRIVLNSSSCDVRSFPPSGLTVRPCYPSSIDRCNVTGMWKERIPVVERLCGLYTHRVDYYGYSSVASNSYRNVFCAVCNGVILTKFVSCSRIASTYVPFPLSVLIDFNSETEGSLEKDNDSTCRRGQVFDPFSRLCRSLQCSERRIIANDDCGHTFSTTEGLGYRFSVVLWPQNTTSNIQERDFRIEYVKELRAILEPFEPVIFKQLELRTFGEFGHNHTELAMISVLAEVVTMSGRRLKDMEQTLKEILTLSIIYSDIDRNNVTFVSAPVPCSWSEDWTNQYFLMGEEMIQDNSTILHLNCEKFDCLSHIMSSPRVELILDCAFVEYNLTLTNFSYDPKSVTVEYDGRTIYLNKSRLLYCGETLQICSDVVAFIQNVLAETRQLQFYRGTKDNLSLAIVSTTCISLSLLALFTAFIVYCSMPSLRTVPGKNMMALVFHLFFAQLFFLIGTSWRENALLCQVVGVMIHYFWLVAFAWMAICAYHMHKVFSDILVLRDKIGQSKQVLLYTLICNLFPLVVVLSCVAYHLSMSEGSDIGYGGDICFLSGSSIILIFFMAPLGLMLLYNMFCFVRTILAIRNVPDMTRSSNKENKQHLLAYIKLSLLLGFTWVFGIIAAIFQSDYVWYVFIVLTGSQGLFIFVAYCVNRRVWEMLKENCRQRHEGIRSKLSLTTSTTKL